MYILDILEAKNEMYCGRYNVVCTHTVESYKNNQNICELMA